MLYKQLQRINQLDQQIQDLHLQLSEFYAERARLLNNDAATPPTVAEQPPVYIATTDPKNIYQQLVAAWKPYGISLPAYKSLAKRMQRAAEVIDSLTASNPQLIGNLHIIAAPPQKQIDHLLSNSDVLARQYVFSEDYGQAKPGRGSTTWNIVVVTGLDFSLPVEQISETLGEAEFRFKDYDCRGLGVRELIAADLQGIEVATDNNWVLLLKDAANTKYVPCATKQNDVIVFDVDDASCLLGNNYLQPAITIR